MMNKAIQIVSSVLIIIGIQTILHKVTTFVENYPPRVIRHSQYSVNNDKRIIKVAFLKELYTRFITNTVQYDNVKLPNEIIDIINEYSDASGVYLRNLLKILHNCPMYSNVSFNCYTCSNGSIISRSDKHKFFKSKTKIIDLFKVANGNAIDIDIILFENDQKLLDKLLGKY